MKIELLQYLVVTAQCSSITDAANRLFLHQTTLSSAIKNIEETIGIKIFSRSKSGITPTEDGKKVIALAQEIVEKWREIMSLSQGGQPAPQSTLLVSTVVADQLSMLLLNAYRQAAPQGNLSIITVPQQQHFASMMLTGKYRMGVGLADPDVSAHAQAVFAEHGFQVTPLGSHKTYLYVSEHSRFADRSAVSFHELRGEHLALSEDGYLNFHTLEHTRVIEKIAVLPNIHLVKNAVEQENMIAFYVPLTTGDEDWFCRGTSIKKLRLLNQPRICTKESFLVYPPDSPLSGPDEALLACILNNFRGG